MWRIVAILLVIIVPVGLIGGLWGWFYGQPHGPEATVMSVCNDLPDDTSLAQRMADNGWTALPEARVSELGNLTGLFHVVSRHSSGQGAFDVDKERAVFESRRDDALENLALPDALMFGRADSAAMAAIVPIKGMPDAWGCDLFLPAQASDDWFKTMIGPYPKLGQSFGWASAQHTSGQLPRPGLWAANLARISPDSSSPSYSELIEMIGFDPQHLILSRNSFRGDRSQ